MALSLVEDNVFIQQDEDFLERVLDAFATDFRYLEQVITQANKVIARSEDKKQD